jgi:fibronectin-binding autotransporter adhesin
VVVSVVSGFGRGFCAASVSSVSPSVGKALQPLTLLCSASAIAMSVVGSAHAGQASLSSFQTYDPTMASTIVPGTLALFQVPVDSLRPTQLNEGLTEVGKKTAGFDLLTPAQLQANLLTDIEPVVIGPGGQLFLTDGHHTFTALENSIFGPSNPNVFVNVIANFSNLTTAQFFAQMQAMNFLLPLNDGVPLPVNTATGAPFPSMLTGLTSDPYRGLEYSILKNKNSKLFTTAGNITGVVGAATPGLDKMNGFYEDFFEAAAYRGANNGLGLPYLSPGDIAIATQWNLTATSKTTLPNIPGTVTAAQLPGFILSGNVTESGVISNATLSTGAIDGNGGFTGITTINAGTAAAPIIIGTPNVGLVMQLGNDGGKTVTLSGANTYTGGTSILAGDLVVANDAALGAAVPTGATIDPNNVKTSVQAANGIIFNSLDEGNGTLTLGTGTGNGSTTFTTARSIAVGGETATINLNGNITTLTGQLVSLGVSGVGVGNATGFSDLTIDDNSNNKGVLILSTASPDFFGNLIIGNSNAPTVRVMNDAALGNTTGPAASIGQVELNGGTLQAGASFAAPERNLFLQSGSNFDVNGFTTSRGNLTDVQRTLEILNSNTTTAGAVTFNSLTIAGTATLQLGEVQPERR